MFSCLLYVRNLRIDLCSLTVSSFVFCLTRVITFAVIVHDNGVIRVIGNILTVILSSVPTYSEM